jgi:hypothetical protein
MHGAHGGFGRGRYFVFLKRPGRIAPGRSFGTQTSIDVRRAIEDPD